MKIYSLLIFIAIYCFSPLKVYAQSIENQIADFLKEKKTTVGVAVLTDDDKCIQYNNPIHYPLFSVFKFHVALAVLDKMDKENISLDSTLHIKASELHENTYSPLQKKFPNQDITISLKELLQYSISLSDNNACDILIGYAGGIQHIHNYIKQLGISDFNLSETEALMHLSPESAYRNWSTPSEVTQLLKIAYEKQLFTQEYKDFLWQTMIETSTGANKIKGLLPPNSIVGHKTGSSDRTPQGMKIGDNDAGVVFLPNGQKYYIAVFVMNSYETDDSNADIIARISKMVYDVMSHND